MAQEDVVVADLLNGAGSEKNNNGSTVTTKAVSFFSVKPQLVVSAPKGADAVQFYKNAFGAEELKRDIHPKRKADQELPLILSAELKLGSSVFQVSDQIDGSAASVTSNGRGITLCIETDDVEGAIAKAVQAGAVAASVAVADKGGEVAEGETAYCGGLVGKVTDPFGYVWLICSTATNRVVDVEA